MAKLSQLFDFQRIADNKELADIIEDTNSRYTMTELGDDLLELVAAGTNLNIKEKKPDE